MKGTTYAAMDSEKGGTVRSNGGPYTAPRTVPGDQVFCHRRSGGTNRSAAHGPGGPILGGTNYRLTVPLGGEHGGKSN